jgi:hypothetical protein
MLKRYLPVFVVAMATIAPIAATASSATASASTVRLVRVTSPISHGSYATLVAHVSPSNVTCSIAVYYTTPRRRPSELDVEGRNTHDARAVADLRPLWQRRDATHVLPGHMTLPSGSHEQIRP